MMASGVSVERMRRPPTHPGEMFEEEFRRPLKLRKTEAAHALGLSPADYRQFVTGKLDVSRELATKLSAVTGTSDRFWLNLQTSLDQWRAFHRR